VEKSAPHGFRFTPRLVVVGILLVAVLAVAVYGLTALFTQTVPSTTVRIVILDDGRRLSFDIVAAFPS